MPQIRRRHARTVDEIHVTINPIRRDQILSGLMREYSERKITLEQIRQRDPQSSRNTKNMSLLELLGRSHS